MYYEQENKDREMRRCVRVEKEEMFDLVIPPGVPRKMIADIIQKFEVDLVERRERLFFANMDGVERDLLAFRGKKEVLEEVEKYLLSRLREFIGDEEPSVEEAAEPP
ncbi:MAG: hypothetical protein QHG99_01010 [Methanomicrobiales archaeon]|nr:hypothetical protein [Methanomicrobiales archaeon]